MTSIPAPSHVEGCWGVDYIPVRNRITRVNVDDVCKQATTSLFVIVERLLFILLLLGTSPSVADSGGSLPAVGS